MIDVNAIFGTFSILLMTLGAIPYIIDIHLGRVRPHIMSWLGWSAITTLGASAMMAGGASWSTSIIWANSLICLFIAIYSALRRAGVWSTTIYDYLFFILGIIGLILWQVLDLPLVALICAILADLSFGIPTIIKTYKDPTSETMTPWIFSTLSGIFSLFAVSTFAFYDVAYPAYLFFYDATILLIVLKIISKRSKPTI